MEPLLWFLMLVCSWVFLLLEFLTLWLRQAWLEALGLRCVVWLLPSICQCMKLLTRRRDTHARLQACARWLLGQDVACMMLVLLLPLGTPAHWYATVVLCVVAALLLSPVVWQWLRATSPQNATEPHVIV